MRGVGFVIVGSGTGWCRRRRHPKGAILVSTAPRRVSNVSILSSCEHLGKNSRGGTDDHVLHRASVSALFVVQLSYSFRETSLEAVTEALLPAASSTSKVSMAAPCLASSVLRRRLYSRILAVLQSCRFQFRI